ncbi:MAG: alkaline phosphatase family protein [Marinobacterium sp.]|nr:alkaline phosphatase family protein [Marinobacterium sp.]
MGKLILIMVDGISADHFERIRHQLPNLDRLAREGTQVLELTPEVCGTSLPGRTSMIVGEGPDQHGIYGNVIWDGEQFRYGNPYDVRVPTLAHYARAAGRDVAALGYGMVRPEECDLYMPPWWVSEMLMRARDEQPWPADEQWLQAGRIHDCEGRLAALGEQQLNIADPNAEPEFKLQLGMLADQQLLDVAAGLAASDKAPDLMMLEICIPDYFLHKYGAGHALAEWSLRTADAQIGTLIERLRQAGQLAQYNFAIMSDHGHAAMPDALYCDQILPQGVKWSSEGGMLLVAPDHAQQADQVRAALSEYAVELWNNSHLPPDQRDVLLTFAVAENSGISFENTLAGQQGPTGPSKYKSNHGMRPGCRDDYRFCLFAGPDVPRSTVLFAQANQVAPTMARILGINTPWQAAPLL